MKIISLVTVVCISNAIQIIVPNTAALAQENPSEPLPGEGKSDAETSTPKPQSSEQENAKAESKSELPFAVVESQKACRVIITGLQGANKSTPIKISKPDGGSLKATVLSNKDGKTVATLSGVGCKQNAKGWKAEIAANPDEQPLQIGALTFEPGSSGWYRAKRKDNYVVGLGGGIQSYLGTGSYFPMSRFELGFSYPQIAFIVSLEIGMGSSSNQLLTISGNSAYEFQFFTGNSLFFRTGWGQETRGSLFTPKRVVGGEVKDAFLGSASSDISFLQVGIGNKWQWGGFGVSVDWLGVRAAMSRTDKVSVSDFVTTQNPDGSTTTEIKEIRDEATIALNEAILRKNVGSGGTFRLLYTSVSYSF